MAVLLILFLLFMYKQMVWDPYFHHTLQGPAAAPTASSAPQPAVQDPYAEPAADRFAEAGHTDEPHTPSASPAVVSSGSPSPVAVLAPPPAANGQYPSESEVGAALTTIETTRLRVSVSALGGRITELLLRDYAAAIGPDAPRLNLVEHAEHAPYPLGVYSGRVDDSHTLYTVSVTPQGTRAPNTPVEIGVGESGSVVLTGQLPDGRAVTKTISFSGSGYFVDVTVDVGAPPADSSRLGVEWTRLVGKDSPSFLDRYGTSGYVWFDGQQALREAFSHLHADAFELLDLRWLAVADKYFLAALISDDGPSPGRVLKTGELFRARLFGSPTEKRVRIYVGPKNYRMLESLGYELRRVIDIGKTGFISVPLMYLLQVLHDVFKNYGLAIVVLTIIVKLLMYPLTASSFRQMKAMQEVAPELNRIKESNKDKQQQQMEMMQLYKDRGVNPLGGCFPILLQKPVAKFVEVFRLQQQHGKDHQE